MSNWFEDNNEWAPWEQRAIAKEINESLKAKEGMKIIKMPEGLTFSRLVERAVRNASPHTAGESPRWVAVMDTFATGSTTAMEICRAFDLDPHERVPGPNCISCNP